MTVVVAVLCGAGLAASLVLLVAAATGWRPRPGSSRAAASRRRDRIDGVDARRRALVALAAGVAVAVLTRWPVLVVTAVLLVWAWPAMVGAAKSSALQIQRLEAVAVWTESLRDTIAGSIALEEAIRNTASAAPPVIAEPLGKLSGALAAHVPLPEAMAAFAEEFRDESIDLVAAALILNARLRGPGLVATLTALSASVREELDMRRRIEQDRRTLRRSARIIMTTAVGFAAFVAVFSRAYMAPYGTVPGQVVLTLVIGVFVLGLVWMRRLAEPRQHERFLARPDALARPDSLAGRTPMSGATP